MSPHIYNKSLLMTDPISFVSLDRLRLSAAPAYSAGLAIDHGALPSHPSRPHLHGEPEVIKQWDRRQS